MQRLFLFTYLRFGKKISTTAYKLKKLDWLTFCIAIGVSLGTPSCAIAKYPTNDSTSPTKIASVSTNELESDRWRIITPEEQKQVWNYILNSPLGIAALNQLAIEGFISPNCPKTFYSDRQSGGFRTLLQVKCSEERGISASASYQEMQVIFERFEDNIESFQVKRIYPDTN